MVTLLFIKFEYKLYFSKIFVVLHTYITFIFGILQINSIFLVFLINILAINIVFYIAAILRYYILYFKIYNLYIFLLILL